MDRVIAYIDGFNLYFGLKSAGLKRYYWLNLQTMAQNLLKPHQELVFTKYFTSRVSYPPDKQSDSPRSSRRWRLSMIFECTTDITRRTLSAAESAATR